MHLITITNINGSQIVVNMDHVAYYYENKDDETVIVFSGVNDNDNIGDDVLVAKESMNEVDKMVEHYQKSKNE